jgi:hypothetical protein
MAIYSLEQLRKIPTEQLIREHDAKAKTTEVGITYYLEEIARRENAKLARQMWVMTLIITILTGVMTCYVIRQAG